MNNEIMPAWQRIALVVAFGSWYFGVRWLLMKAARCYDSGGFFTFSFWWSTLTAIPVTLISMLAVTGVMEVAYWAMTGKWL